VIINRQATSYTELSDLLRREYVSIKSKLNTSPKMSRKSYDLTVCWCRLSQVQSEPHSAGQSTDLSSCLTDSVPESPQHLGNHATSLTWDVTRHLKRVPARLAYYFLFPSTLTGQRKHCQLQTEFQWI
jgi:hypothetical protein